MNQETEQSGTTRHDNPPKKRTNSLILIVVVILIVIGNLVPAPKTAKTADLSALANLSENDLIFMRCEKFETLNQESQVEIVRRMFAHYKLPIKDDEVKERREDVNYECSKKPLNKALPQYIRVFLGIMEIPLR